MPLPDDQFVENVSDTDNANTIIRRAMSAAKQSERYVEMGLQFIDYGVKCSEIAERLGRTALYVATVEKPTRIDDSGQSDDPDGPDGSNGPDDPIDPDPPYDYDENIKPNGKAVDGIGYSEP